MDITPVFLATLGQRPQAVTMALDRLFPQHHYHEIKILHTDLDDPRGIHKAFEEVMPVLEAKYGYDLIKSVALSFDDGKPIVDINNLWSAEAYFHSIASEIRKYRIHNVPIHLLIAGGRKAMSVYATLAGGLLFGENDRVWTILTSQELLDEGDFHIPAGRHDEVELVNLPVKPSRLLPGIIKDVPLDVLLAKRTRSPRSMFFSGLTTSEQLIVEALRAYPYASNEDLANKLTKSKKTIENQLRSIYIRLSHYYDVDEVTNARKREVLRDVIQGRV